MLSFKEGNKKASDIKLFYLYSTIKMMHVPINIRFNNTFCFPPFLADPWVTADYPLIPTALISYYKQTQNTSQTADTCTALLALLLVSGEQTQSFSETCKCQVWMVVTGEQQVFSSQQFQCVQYSNSEYKLIFFFPIKIFRNFCSKPR